MEVLENCNVKARRRPSSPTASLELTLGRSLIGGILLFGIRHFLPLQQHLSCPHLRSQVPPVSGAGPDPFRRASYWAVDTVLSA